MANTPQAKKRIRRNERRNEINGARTSRIRTSADLDVAASRFQGPAGHSIGGPFALRRCDSKTLAQCTIRAMYAKASSSKSLENIVKI
jgi:hypothetical protein